MTTIFNETRNAVDSARQKITAMMDVSEVPDGSAVEEKVTSAFVSLEEALEQIPREANNIFALDEEGPIVYPVAGTDPRDWPTSAGKVARIAILQASGVSRKASKVASSHQRLAMPEYARPHKRRALTRTEYIAALENAKPVKAPVASHEDASAFSIVLSRFNNILPTFSPELTG